MQTWLILASLSHIMLHPQHAQLKANESKRNSQEFVKKSSFFWLIGENIEHTNRKKSDVLANSNSPIFLRLM